MASVVNNFFEKVKTGWNELTYVSPEEQEKRRIEREKRLELERIRREEEAARDRAAERFAKDAKLLYDSLIDEGFTEEQAIQLAKGMRISMEE